MAVREVRQILIVEDAQIVASGMRATVEADPDNLVVAIVPSVELADEVLAERHVDIVIADVRLEDGTAFDLLKRVNQRTPRPAVLIVSSYDLAQYVDAALKQGASGYILKTAPAKDLMNAIRAVADGGWAFDAGLVSRATEAQQLGLSLRERQVVAGLMAGRTNDEIGLDLGISKKTVEAHVSRLFARFGLSGRAELTVRAAKEDWLASPTSDTEPPG